MDIPEAMLMTQCRQMLDDFSRRMQSQGLSMDQYFQFTGMTADKMMDELRPQAEKRIRTRLVLEAIVAAENIEVSDERLDEELAKMAESYKMEVEKLKEFMGENEKKQMKEDIAEKKTITLIVEGSVVGYSFIRFLESVRLYIRCAFSLSIRSERMRTDPGVRIRTIIMRCW